MGSILEFYDPNDALVPNEVISYLMALFQLMVILLKAASGRPSTMSSKLSHTKGKEMNNSGQISGGLFYAGRKPAGL